MPARSPEARRVKAEYNRLRQPAVDLKRRYGLTPTARENMAIRQGHKCAICRVGPSEYVDHDHATGRVRGLLCTHCNRGLGGFRDEPNFLRAAVAYLES